jgi:hypothetical protein
VSICGLNFVKLWYGLCKGASVVFRLDKTAADAHKILCEAYSNETLSKLTQIYEWHKHFDSGRASADFQLWEMFFDCPSERHLCRSLTVQEVAEETGIFSGSCHTIFTEDLGMTQVSVKFMPRLLTNTREFTMFQPSEVSYSKQMTMTFFFKSSLSGMRLGL